MYVCVGGGGVYTHGTGWPGSVATSHSPAIHELGPTTVSFLPDPHILKWACKAKAHTYRHVAKPHTRTSLLVLYHSIACLSPPCLPPPLQKVKADLPSYVDLARRVDELVGGRENAAPAWVTYRRLLTTYAALRPVRACVRARVRACPFQHC